MSDALLTIEDKTYVKLRTKILHGELPMGEFLSQRMLGEQVGAAVVTVRAAMRRLERDGLVESQPKWGFRIVSETEEQIRDRYFIRELLEVGAVERIVNRRNPDDGARLLRLAQRVDEIHPDGAETSIAEFARQHSALHMAMAECSGSQLLVESLERLNLRALMVYNATRGWARGNDRVPSYHQELIKVILTYDMAQAVDAIRQHVRRGLHHELDAIRDNGSSVH